MTKNKSNISKIFSSNWIITLTATLLGVFGALFLNERTSSNKLRNQKTVAKKNILTEIASNQESLEKASSQHMSLMKTFIFLSNYINEEDNLVAPIDSMNIFRAEYPEIVTIQDSTILDNGYCEYKGEINFDVSLPHFELTTIAWETLKNSSISDSYNFECLMYLQKIDNLTQEILQMDGELLEYMIGARDGGEKNKHIINHLRLLINYEKTLLSVYEPHQKELENCS